MFLDRLFRPKATQEKGRALYAAAVDRSREPFLYERFGAPDTVEGRFEIYTMHVMLLLDRLRGHGALAAQVSQELFDTYLSALDDALREMGVGDLSVGKKMRRLGEAFYGRAKSYEAALAALPDQTALQQLIARTVLAGAEGADGAGLASYVVAQRDALAAQPLDEALDARLVWGAP